MILYKEVYFDGQGICSGRKMEFVERYHKNPNMWEYMRKTRIPVDDIFELVDQRKQRSR